MALRLFVAFELPEAVREAVGRRMAKARTDLPRARWVRPEGLHLTLKFLGPTAEALLPALTPALAAAFAAAPPLAARLAGAGTFPPERPARVAWLGLTVDGGRAPLVELALRLDRVAHEVAGVAPESRPFAAHVTLARCDPPWPRRAAEAFAAAFADLEVAPFTWADGVLVESTPAPGGSRYGALARFPLGPGTSGGARA